ncbi:hypothetical protein NHJ13051_002808 [Beauveria bassiana]
MHDIGNPTTQPAAQPRVQFNTAPWHLSGLQAMKTCRPRARYALSRLEPRRLPSRVMATAAPPPPGKAAGGAVERPMSAQDVHGLQEGNENQNLAVS